MFSRLKNKNVGIFGCNFVTLITFGCNLWDFLMLFGWLFLVIYFALCLRMDEGYYSRRYLDANGKWQVLSDFRESLNIWRILEMCVLSK